MSVSKIDILKEIGHKIYRYYVFISNDGIFNWYDLEGNHIENIDLTYLIAYLPEYLIPKTISKCIIPVGIKQIADGAFFNCWSLTTVYIPNTVKYIGYYAFSMCDALKEIVFKGKTLEEVKRMENYPWDIKDESIIKCEL
jgi:hypothetical protein